ncbi:MAG: AAA family ATPase [Candidatus Aminicenantes bacterium]|nr:AAA family ATPase [Candidatus Aminicenantes bacterium]
MKQIVYVEIENFKVFGEKIHIELDHPAVLIGPNNAGKTSVIQALALWSRGIRSWYERKGQPGKKKLEKLSAGINRLNILEVPVAETRFFWNKTRVKKGKNPVELIINVGLEFKRKVYDCRLVFKQRDSEVIYCRPCPETAANEELLAHTAKLRFNLLYPMSGIDREEPLLQEGRIDVLMGQGQTAQVLRNLCYLVAERTVEKDEVTGKSGWQSITGLIEQLFMIELKKPLLDANRGTVILKYRQQGVESDLDISLAGRGVQQMLLVLAYLYAHKGSILLIDEPDAHLEILRQKQVYEILKQVASENGCQVVIATHSEVILNDAVDKNLTLLINGKAVNLAARADMKHALRTFGIEHYYKARVLPRILYIEGSTDLGNLKALAKKIEHPAYDILNGKLNYYYTQNIDPEDSLDSRLDRAAGAYADYRQHFHTLKKFVDGFKGIALFDGDGRQPEDDIRDDLAVVSWKDYELENYFITPEVILDFTDDYYRDADELFKSTYHKDMREIIDQRLLAEVFSGDMEQLQEFRETGRSLRRTILKNVKMSSFAEHVFGRFAEKQGQPVLLKKSEFYLLIDYVDKRDIPNEVSQKLDLIVKYLYWEGEG